jgi:hypothetical protein
MSDPVEQAREIALDVLRRRAAGELISDDSVLQSHPHLEKQLREQLRRLEMVSRARQQVELAATDVRSGQTSGDFAAVGEPPESAAGMRAEDIRVTVAEHRDEQDVLRGTMIVGQSAIEPVRPPENNQRARLLRPLHRPPMALLKVYHDSQRSFDLHRVTSERCGIGRAGPDVAIPHDMQMSARHAEIQRRQRSDGFEWYLVDLNSTNGTFVRAARARLKHDDELLLGSQRYRFLQTDGGAGLAQVLPGDDGEIWWLESQSAWIGRDTPARPACFQDEYLDPKHALLYVDGSGHWVVKDTDSLNGVWYRTHEVHLVRSCSFQLGEQRFGFLLDPPPSRVQ